MRTVSTILKGFEMILDIIVILILISGLIRGYRIGLIKQSVQAGSLILAFIVAMYYFQPLGNLMIKLLKQLQLKPDIQWLYVSDIIAFVLLFSITQAVYTSLGKHLNGVTRLPGLHLGDELLGSVMGLLTRYLVTFFLLNILILFPMSWLQDQYHESTISQTIVKKTPIISEWQSRHLITHSRAKQKSELGVINNEMAK